MASLPAPAVRGNAPPSTPCTRGPAECSTAYRARVDAGLVGNAPPHGSPFWNDVARILASPWDACGSPFVYAPRGRVWGIP